uniref:Uncharacterized protein n=1 Tax=Pyxicephalus adspersus TaxID=30357 RepID=A0AAV3BA38_PYXAD|nr:TPA: hypothetical protein GDO54_000857 [Pyxicephalus adspersus]
MLNHQIAGLVILCCPYFTLYDLFLILLKCKRRTHCPRVNFFFQDKKMKNCIRSKISQFLKDSSFLQSASDIFSPPKIHCLM